MDNFCGRGASRRPFRSTSGGLRRSGSERAQSRRVGWLVSRETERSMIPGCAGHPSRFSPGGGTRSIGRGPLPFHVKRATDPAGCGTPPRTCSPDCCEDRLHPLEREKPFHRRSGIHPGHGCRCRIPGDGLRGRSHRRSSGAALPEILVASRWAYLRDADRAVAAGPTSARQSARRNARCLRTRAAPTTNSSHRVGSRLKRPGPAAPSRSDPLGPSRRSVGNGTACAPSGDLIPEPLADAGPGTSAAGRVCGLSATLASVVARHRSPLGSAAPVTRSG